MRGGCSTSRQQYVKWRPATRPAIRQASRPADQPTNQPTRHPTSVAGGHPHPTPVAYDTASGFHLHFPHATTAHRRAAEARTPTASAAGDKASAASARSHEPLGRARSPVLYRRYIAADLATPARQTLRSRLRRGAFRGNARYVCARGG